MSNQPIATSGEHRAQTTLKKDQYKRELAHANTALAFASLKAFSGGNHTVCNLTDFMQSADKIIDVCLSYNDKVNVISIYEWTCGKLNTELRNQGHTREYKNLCRYAIDLYSERADAYCKTLGHNVLPFSRAGLCTSSPCYDAQKLN